MKPPFVLSSCDSIISLHEYYLTNPNGKGLWNWITNNISKFYNNPTIKESEIVVLSREFWVSAGKEKVTMRSIFISAPTWFQNSQRWACLELSCEPDVQFSRQSNGEWVWDHYFSEIGFVACEKKKGFWEKRQKQKWAEEDALLVWKQKLT